MPNQQLLLVLARLVAVDSEQTADVSEREPTQTPNVALAHRAIREQTLALLDLEETVLDCVADEETLDLHGLGLADAVRTVDGLVLRGGVPLQLANVILFSVVLAHTARSHIITLLAMVKLRPTPPALVEMSMTGIESAMSGGVEKRRMASSRLLCDMLPRYPTLRTPCSPRKSCSRSRNCTNWEKTRILVFGSCSRYPFTSSLPC